MAGAGWPVVSDASGFAGVAAMAYGLGQVLAVGPAFGGKALSAAGLDGCLLGWAALTDLGAPLQLQ